MLLLLRSLSLGQLLSLSLGELLARLVVRRQPVVVVLGVKIRVLTLLEQLPGWHPRQRLLLRRFPRSLLLLPTLLRLLLSLGLRLPSRLVPQLLRVGQLPQRAAFPVVQLDAQLGQTDVADLVARPHERLGIRARPRQRANLVAELDDEIQRGSHGLLLAGVAAPVAAADVAQADPPGGLRDAQARQDHRHEPSRGL